MGPLVFPGGPGFSLWLHWDRMSETPDALTFARVLPAMQTKHGLSQSPRARVLASRNTFVWKDETRGKVQILSPSRLTLD